MPAIEGVSSARTSTDPSRGVERPHAPLGGPRELVAMALVRRGVSRSRTMIARRIRGLLLVAFVGASACGAAPFSTTDGGPDEGPAQPPTDASDAPPHDATGDAPDATRDVGDDVTPDAPDTMFDAAPDVLDAAPDAPDARVAPPNATCAGALPVLDGTALTGQDTAAAHETSAACPLKTSGGQLYYAATVPAGRTLVAVVSPTGMPWNPVLRLLGACGAGRCLGLTNDNLTGEGEALAYTNPGPADMPVVLTVSSNLAASAGTFDLAVRVRSPLPHGACAAAMELGPDAALTDQWLPLAGAPSRACGGDAPGAQLHYRVTVPAGRRLTASVTARAPVPWLPALRLAGGCDADACLARSEVAFDGAPQTLAWTNADATPRAVLLSVGSVTGASAAFDLALSVAAP